MKRNMVCLRGSVLFCLLLAVGLVGPWVTNGAMAQVRPALTASVDDPGRTPYKATIRQYCYLVDAACDFTFPTVPAGKRLVIKHVSGYFSSRQADATQFLFVSVRRGGDDVSFLPTTYQGP